MRKYLLLTLLALLPLIASAYDACIDGIYYNFYGEEAEVTYGDRNETESYSGSIVIPRSVTYLGNRYLVTSIGSYTFDGCEQLTSITIPNSVISIGRDAFEDCYSLTSISIPESVISIGNGAFSRCRNLKSVIIPNSVTTIDEGAFTDCRSLATVTIPGSVKNIADDVFEDCKGLTSVIIEYGVISIGKDMFRYCTSLTTITIPNSVVNIGRRAFSKCPNLISITIPNSVTSIGEDAFQGCYFAEDAFMNYSDLTDEGNWGLTLCDQETSDGLLLNNQEVLVKCRPGMSSVSIPKYVTAIENYAFRDCANLTSIIVPQSVKAIGEYAFVGCKGLVSVTIGNNVINISQESRSGSKGMAKAPAVESETIIGNYAFYGCSELTSVTIGSDITEIGSYTFGYCDKLHDIYCLAEEVPNTDAGAFNGTSISSATLHVPESAVNDYKSTAPWSGFGTIVGIEPEYILGDANGNGEVEIGDITSVLTLMATPAATGYNNKAADANKNGVIEIGDVTTILTIMASGE